MHVDPRDMLVHHLHAATSCSGTGDMEQHAACQGSRQHRMLTLAHTAAAVVAHQESPRA